MAQSVTAQSLRIGTRGSPLALAQAAMVRARLSAAHGLDPAAIETRVIKTSGDRIQDRSLADAGGKGLFTKEIEEALLADEIDLAVHSAKDLPTFLPNGLMLAACLEREDARDVFISRKAAALKDLAQGARLGTASPRRQAQVLRLRPDLKVEMLRGNVETRLRKIDEGVVDATLLALAGLKRLGLQDAATAILDADDFLPAIGQGAIALETRQGDERTLGLLSAIDHRDTFDALICERAFLAMLDGSCRTPIAGHAVISDGQLRFRGMIIRPDGSELFETSREGRAGSAETIGSDAGRDLKARGGPDFFVHG